MEENENIEKRVMGLFTGVKATRDNSLKAQLTVEAGDLRREQYLTEENPRAKANYQRLARNCYFAARNFHYRN
jgi:hypothetical protein